MEMLGPCMICGKPARFTCSVCGRLVCTEHYDTDSGLCSDDARKARHRGKGGTEKERDASRLLK
jgi:hypothetical protein